MTRLFRQKISHISVIVAKIAQNLNKFWVLFPRIIAKMLKMSPKLSNYHSIWLHCFKVTSVFAFLQPSTMSFYLLDILKSVGCRFWKKSSGGDNLWLLHLSNPSKKMFIFSKNRLFFFILLLFKNNFAEMIENSSGIRTRIFGVEGKHANHLTTIIFKQKASSNLPNFTWQFFCKMQCSQLQLTTKCTLQTSNYHLTLEERYFSAV